MAEFVDMHVQGLADRVKQLEAERAKKVAKVEEITTDIGRIDTNLARVRDRFTAALARTSKVQVDEAKVKRAARKRARNARARKPGQYVAIPTESVIGQVLHLGMTTEASPTNIVTVKYLCGRGSQSLGRDMALNLARQTRGDLSIALGLVRSIKRSDYRRAACGGCTAAARKELRPAKVEAPDA